MCAKQNPNIQASFTLEKKCPNEGWTANGGDLPEPKMSACSEAENVNFKLAGMQLPIPPLLISK
jgi:hypothetical protein